MRLTVAQALVRFLAVQEIERDPKGYHVDEYGYSCMGCEIPGGIGAKLAAPERDVREALAAAADADWPVVVHGEVDRYEGVPSYESWWDVPVAEVATSEPVQAARAEYERARQAQRRHVRPPSDAPVAGGRR
jgi:TPP-dependent trihydroxycyclohexane-1,2-dione (THcHDO) dehydratase